MMAVTRRGFIQGALAVLGTLATFSRFVPIDERLMWDGYDDPNDGPSDGPEDWCQVSDSEDEASVPIYYEFHPAPIGVYAGNGDVVVWGSVEHPLAVRHFEAAEGLRSGDWVTLDPNGKLIRV